MGRLLRTFGGFPALEYVLDELPMDQGWAFFSWSMENDGWLQFGGVRRDGPGYLGQAIAPLMAVAKEAYKL